MWYLSMSVFFFTEQHALVHCISVYFSYLWEQNDNTYSLPLLNESKGLKALKNIYTILNEYVWPLVDVAEAALNAAEWNFSTWYIVPLMWSYHSCFDYKAADLRSILSCSCLDELAGPSITDHLLARTYRCGPTSKNKLMLLSCLFMATKKHIKKTIAKTACPMLSLQ